MDREKKEKIRQEIREAFGLALEEARNETGLSQERLARAVDLDRTTVSLLERSKQSATIETLWILCEELDDSPSELIARVQKFRKPKKKTRST